MANEPIQSICDLQFHHLGLVVRDISEGKQRLTELFGEMTWSKTSIDPLQSVSVCFGSGANNSFLYELIEPMRDGSPIDNVIETSNNILNHVAYTSADFDNSLLRLRSLGCMPLGSPKPAVAFNNKRVAFYLTKLNFILEIIEVTE